jgi:hypothetical protein
MCAQENHFLDRRKSFSCAHFPEKESLGFSEFKKLK